MRRWITIPVGGGLPANPVAPGYTPLPSITPTLTVVSNTKINVGFSIPVGAIPTPPTPDVPSFYLQRSLTGTDPWTVLGTFNSSQSGSAYVYTYADTGLNPGATYYYRAAIVTQETPSRQSAWGGTVSATTTSSSGVKFHYGWYVLSSQVDIPQNSGSTGSWWSNTKNEINQVSGQTSNIKGFVVNIEWAVLESTQGTYNFADIDTAYNYVTSQGLRLGLQISIEHFATDPTETVPTYIYNNPSTYGAGQDGTHGGYWTLGFGSIQGCVVAWWRSAVYARIEALYAALAAHVLPSGNTVDADPLVEIVGIGESALSFYPNTPSDYSIGTAETAWQAMQASFVGSFPHTNVLDQNNYLGTQAVTANTMYADGTAGVAIGGPDIFTGATTNWTWSQQGYRGQFGAYGSGNGFTVDLAGTFPYIAHIESPDFGAISDLFNTATASSPTAGLKASHVLVAIVNKGANQPGDWATVVLPFIQNNPIPSNNNVCSSVYVNSRGGCNSS